MHFIYLISILVLSSGIFSVSQEEATLANWPQWRGSNGNGVALKGDPPVQFSETKNLKWKIPIPGKGHATPIVWGDKIVVQTSVPTDEKVEPAKDVSEENEGRRRMSGSKTDAIHEFKVILVNRNNGNIEWEKTVTKEFPEESTHNLGSWASNSPCTDGEFIYAYFGSRGLYCLDFKGNIIWERDFGQLEKNMSFGEGSSPFLYKEKLFIQWDHEGQSYLFAIDTKTGKDSWKLERDERTSWASPFVVEAAGKTQVITAATNKIRSNDYETGELIWTSTGLTRNVIPVPVYEDGTLYVMSGFRGSALQAIDLSKASGDITGTEAIIWTYDEHTPYTPCPVLMNGKLYFMRVNNGYLTCLEAKNGSVVYANQKLEGISSVYSSPTGVNNRLYVVAKNICLVLSAGDKFEILQTNELDDDFHASPVIVDNDLILRGFNSLYCFNSEQ